MHIFKFIRSTVTKFMNRCSQLSERLCFTTNRHDMKGSCEFLLDCKEINWYRILNCCLRGKLLSSSRLCNCTQFERIKFSLIRTKIQTFTTNVKSFLLFGHETWKITKQISNSLQLVPMMYSKHQMAGWNFKWGIMAEIEINTCWTTNEGKKIVLDCS
jgi:hypothetical protein